MKLFNIENEMLRRFSFFFIIFVGCTWSGFSVANCMFTGSGQTATVNFDNIPVSNALPIGAIISTAIPSPNAQPVTVIDDCTTNLLMTYMGGTPVSGMNGVYKTNLNGVGISICNSSFNGSDFSSCETFYQNPAESYQLLGRGNFTPGTAVIALIKTGDITAGALESGPLGAVYLEGDEANYDIKFMLGSSSVTSTGCKITTPTLNVNLGDFLTTDFTGVGYKTKQVSLPISLQCNAGTKVNAVLAAESDSDSQNTGVIKLSSDADSASGIGIQLIDGKGQVLKLNENIYVGMAASEGDFEFNWTASYIQTQSVVTPGNANASATITLTYE
ncbi:fimbrial protein [Rahnella victoriana]|uniref:fimbrial protein n=1 Tax=Rahnella victoriana TaxID=1510570 RepID=UPI001E5E0203|nr:fimbrial protein [Rahnella victoriana]UHM93640.1 fimbrial protein [Rahnella victoriana]